MVVETTDTRSRYDLPLTAASRPVLGSLLLESTVGAILVIVLKGDPVLANHTVRLLCLVLRLTINSQ
jgi:hypothetical protein